MYFTRDDLNNPVFWKYMKIQWIIYWVVAICMFIAGFIFNHIEAFIFGLIFLLGLSFMQYYLYCCKKKDKDDQEKLAELINNIDYQDNKELV